MRTEENIKRILLNLRSIGLENEVVEFKEAKKQYDFDKNWEIANHTTGRLTFIELNALNLEGVERIREQARSEDWSAVTIGIATIKDLFSRAILKARDSFKQKNSHLTEEIDDWDDITFLNKAKVCIKGKITRAAILLLGKSETEYLISPFVAKIS